MIPYYIVLILLNLIGLILVPLTLLPDVALPSTITAPIITFSHYFGMLWSTIPFTIVALFGATILIIGFESKITAYKIIKWIYNKIPGVG